MLVLISLLLTPAAFAQLQAPCTDEDAYQTKGVWANQKKDDLAMADTTFPNTQHTAVLSKAQVAIVLVTSANPQFVGLDAFAYRSIRGNPLAADGPVPFGVTAMYFSYYCVPDTPSYPKLRGQILRGGETETKVEVDFNSLGWLANEKLSLGKHLLTPDGEIIFYAAKDTGEIKGLTLLRPGLQSRVKDEAVVITRSGSSPFIAVTREQFLRSLEIFERNTVKKIEGDAQKVAIDAERSVAKIERENLMNAQQQVQIKESLRKGAIQAQANLEKSVKIAEARVAKVKTALDALSPAERQSQAIIRSQSDDPNKLFVTEAEGGRRLVTINSTLFDPRLPRHAVQLITVYWSWDEKHRAKSEMIRQFKENFDFKALAEMLGK